ncbi:MAG: hypothetical protein GAK35_03333 [Herbaspirillum frisingense]|uniref:C-type lectin domain-containing protein n=1 Tax=Herbaspirillum frisingense TaxID=92645 RepID=A0A7V8FUG5_9BURK|nr:MAG: hypothetical protein GAK35_03333 [Herbaspirillum frisingense]
MSTAISRRGDTTANIATMVSVPRELVVDTTKWTLTIQDGGATPGGFVLARAEFTKYSFVKANPRAAAFTKTGPGAAQTAQALVVEVADLVIKYASGTAITMPALTAGTDYAIYACADGSLRADANFTAPTGYTTANSRQIGGFHYAPGGNATQKNGGGNTTAQINEVSFWDLKFRPNCDDPRGMALVAGKFWADIYILGVNHITDGTSKYNVAMATGSAPPKVPTLFGGNGTTAYADGNWFSFREVMAAYGKRFPTYAEFAALAFGTKEKVSAGPASGGSAPLTGQNNTGYTSTWENFTSLFGIIQASGNLWVWGEEFGGPYGAASYADTPDARGQWYSPPNAALFGGNWNNTTNSGSRASYWNDAPSASTASIGARGVCDHLVLA